MKPTEARGILVKLRFAYSPEGALSSKTARAADGLVLCLIWSKEFDKRYFPKYGKMVL